MQTITDFAVPIAANDNQPRHADAFNTLAERRSWIAGLKMQKNDSDIEPVLACPTLARLKKSGDKRAGTLLQWVDMMAPLHMSGQLSAANDNAPTEDGWERSLWAEPQDKGDKLDADMLLEIRPTINELMSASGRVSVRSKRSFSGKWNALTRHTHQLVVGKHKGRSRTAVGLDEIVGWFDRNGIERRAGVSLAGPKGGSKQSRSAADIARYLDRPGSPFPRPWLAFDGGRQSERTETAIAAQAVLDDAVANTLTMPNPTRCPTAIAEGAHWIGGMVSSSGGAGGSLDASAIESEIARTATARSVRAKLGAGTVAILDMAATRMTAIEIGREFGFDGKYAERWAIAAINMAIDKIAA